MRAVDFPSVAHAEQQSRNLGYPETPQSLGDGVSVLMTHVAVPSIAPRCGKRTKLELRFGLTTVFFIVVVDAPLGLLSCFLNVAFLSVLSRFCLSSKNVFYVFVQILVFLG